MEQALLQYQQDERVEYRCPSCPSLIAIKRATIRHLQNTLIITLNRFINEVVRVDANQTTTKLVKINKRIDFPFQLNINHSIYKLVAIINHLNLNETISSGHYTTFTLNKNNDWISFNDAEVKIININKLMTQVILNK